MVEWSKVGWGGVHWWSMGRCEELSRENKAGDEQAQRLLFVPC